MKNSPHNLLIRSRRRRSNPQTRSLFQETRLHPSNFIQPIFIQKSNTPKTPIPSMPNIYRHNYDSLIKQCQQCIQYGIQAVALFPVIPDSDKDATGSASLTPKNITFEAIKKIKNELPQLLVIADVALDPYTNHGHDGILNASTQDVDNDQTVKALTKLATALSTAGADFVAPSDMMDGRILAIRQSLDNQGFQNTGIISYAAKYASSLYGPFRQAVKSAHNSQYLDKKTYQLNPSNSREAIDDALLDITEGADALMIKPATWYLDIITKLKEKTHLPIAAYQVSGEYSQIHASAKNGWIDLNSAIYESLTSIRRAGADIVFTYFAKDIATLLKEKYQ